MGVFRKVETDLGAIRHNVAQIRAIVGVDVMAVVKANAYGHGSVRVAEAAIAAGASWLGVADVSEARVLREAGISAPILAWLHAPDSDFNEAATLGVQVGLNNVAQLKAAAKAGVSAAHLKVDSGLRRNGASPAQWDEFFAVAAELQQSGSLNITGIFSHLSGTSRLDDLAQVAEFERAIGTATAAGLEVPIRHLAATGAALTLPESRFDLVRIGIGLYGLAPFDGFDSAEADLRPAMRLSAEVAMVKRVPAGLGISYGYLAKTSSHLGGETTLALVPLGYADGIPRAAGEPARVLIGGKQYPVAGRIAMDQFVVDVGDDPIAIGDEVVVFGDPRRGEPSADTWASAAGTINYEIVTRVSGSRTEWVYVDRD